MEHNLLVVILLTMVLVTIVIIWHQYHEIKEIKDSDDNIVAIRQAEKLIIMLDPRMPGRDRWLIEHGYGIEAEALRRAASDFI
jgi:hypothetical protein